MADFPANSSYVAITTISKNSSSIFKHTAESSPKAPLGKRSTTLLINGLILNRVSNTGKVEFDKIHTEGAIRPTKLGAKNWMFIENKDNRWRSAVIYTFVGSWMSTN